MPQSISTKGQLEAPSYYVDENLGRKFVSHLHVGGLRATFALDIFPPRTDDTIWLPYVANNKLVAITKDKLDVPKEQAAVLEHGAKAFILTGRGHVAAWAALFLRRQDRIRKLLALHEGGFLAKLYFDGGEIRVIPCDEILSRLSRFRVWR